MKLLNLIAFPATVVLGILLVLSSFAPNISPATNSWIPLLGLGFPVLFLLMTLALVYWLIQRKWRSLFALSCLLLNLGPASLYVQWNDQPEVHQPDAIPTETSNVPPSSTVQTLKVVTYNAQLFGLYQ
ncbi:MAG: hypothetical protein ACKOI1_02880, partial [Bacteroidota bacterium]